MYPELDICSNSLGQQTMKLRDIIFIHLLMQYVLIFLDIRICYFLFLFIVNIPNYQADNTLVIQCVALVLTKELPYM